MHSTFKIHFENIMYMYVYIYIYMYSYFFILYIHSICHEFMHYSTDFMYYIVVACIHTKWFPSLVGTNPLIGIQPQRSAL